MSSDDIGIRISPHTRAAELVYKNASVQTRLDTHFGIQSVQSSNDEERALTDAELSGWKDLPLLADLKKKFAVCMPTIRRYGDQSLTPNRSSNALPR